MQRNPAFNEDPKAPAEVRADRVVIVTEDRLCEVPKGIAVA